MPAPLEAHRDVVIGVPSLGLLPPISQPVAEPPGRTFAKPLRARLLQIQPLVGHFVVFGHAEPPVRNWRVYQRAETAWRPGRAMEPAATPALLPRRTPER